MNGILYLIIGLSIGFLVGLFYSSWWYNKRLDEVIKDPLGNKEVPK